MIQKNHRFHSFRKAYTFQEAVISIILGGEKPADDLGTLVSDHMSQLSLHSIISTPRK